jgi:hypothetical protein
MQNKELEKVEIKSPSDYMGEEFSNRSYTIFFRQGNNPQGSKNFIFTGSFRDAMVRARAHCDKMGYRFILLRPMLADLELDEKNRQNGINV